MARKSGRRLETPPGSSFLFLLRGERRYKATTEPASNQKWFLTHESATHERLNAECSRIQSSNWTLKGTGSPKASGRLSPTNINNDVDDPVFRSEMLHLTALCARVYSSTCPDLHGPQTSSAGFHEAGFPLIPIYPIQGFVFPPKP